MLKHGHAREGNKSRVYSSWLGMKRRCYDKGRSAYKSYHGRGIYVCHEWRNDFARFLADMGEPPKGMTIERINNDGPYAPSNCRWATRAEQSINRRVTRLLTFRGQTKAMSVWTKELGFGDGTVRYRLRKGWSVEEALTRKARPDGR